MNARKKLNAAYVTGAVVMASIIGAITQSWIVFVISTAVLTMLSLHAGEIRLRKND